MRQGTGIFNGLLTAVIVMMLMVWAFTTLTNNDPLWFTRSFNERAERLVIYWEGETYTLHRGDPGYDAVMEAFAKGVANWAGYEGKVVFSEESITRYREEWRLLEVTFSYPVQVHIRHPYPKAKTYLVPLDKTHGKWARVFAFPGFVPHASGPLNMGQEAFDGLVHAVEIAVAGGH